MASIMEQSSRRQDEPSSDFNLREWALKARMISRENTNSRRFSASNIRSFREDTRSFRSNITISSTASSPGYPLRGNPPDTSIFSVLSSLSLFKPSHSVTSVCFSQKRLIRQLTLSALLSKASINSLKLAAVTVKILSF